MNLFELLDGIIEIPSTQERNIEVKGITLDSRKVTAGYVFFAMAGSARHGLAHAQEAIDNGAEAIIYETSGSNEFALKQNVYQLAVDDLASKLGGIASRFYKSPSEKLDVIGVTGTNGKTTCSQFLLQLIPDCGVIGTLGWGEKGKLNKIENTTPDVLTVYRLLADFTRKKKATVVMEVSSHGLQQGRVDSVCFKGAVFTNLSRDHLDYHGSMDDYLQAKLVLFKQPDLQFVVVNADDLCSSQVLAVVNDKVKCWAFSGSGKPLESIENVTAEKIEYGLNGIRCFVCWRNEKALLQTSIVGDFNLENILAVLTVLLAQGNLLHDAVAKANKLVPVAGRMECFGGGEKPRVVVDFAHSPDALTKVLQSVRKFCQQKLILVFGCGGNRDEGKRAEMGSIAENVADQVIVTTDNPRFESPENIISDILMECSKEITEVIHDRKQAIQTAIKRAEKDDCVVVAGKGHEDFQDVNGLKQPFNDQEIVRQALHGWIS